jgi:dihydroxyacetone kinase-like protein
MIDKLTFKDFKRIINKVNETIQENKMLLSKLDSVIGDGDHGITIAKGMESAMVKINETNPSNISDLLKTVGNTIIITIGGVAGPIFGSLFAEMGRKIETTKDRVDIKDLYNMFKASLEKVMTIGTAKPGDKTMIDAFYPAVKSLEESVTLNKDIKEAFKKMVIVAKNGAESTKDMVASRGRSSYCGERSIGYEDAGANTVYFMLKAFYEAV